MTAPPGDRPPTPSLLARISTAFHELLQLDPREQLEAGLHLVKWIVLGALSGVLAGLAAAAFLEALDWAGEVRLDNPWIIGFLPIAGLLVGLAYHYGGDRAEEGNNLIIDEIHAPKAWVPRRMAPMVFLGTVTTQLFGGSAGREGAAIQMSGSLTDAASRVLHLSERDRRLMLITAIAGGFGAVFGVPIAGAVFALEVQAVGRIRYDAIVPCLTASIIGDMVVRAVGVHHAPTPHLGEVPLDLALLGKVAVAGLLFGLVGILFSELTHGIKHLFRSWVAWAPARPFIGGVIVIGLTLLVGSQRYNGLSLPLAAVALHGGDVPTFAFLLKILFTAVTLGAGFQGGEVTPLFIVGATLGATLALVLGVPVTFLAALGFVAVFAGAANTPIACTIMGAELFGAGAISYFAVACVVSYIFSSHRGIYSSQRLAVSKTAAGTDGEAPDGTESLGEVATRRRYWFGRKGPAS